MTSPLPMRGLSRDNAAQRVPLDEKAERRDHLKTKLPGVYQPHNQVQRATIVPQPDRAPTPMASRVVEIASLNEDGQTEVINRRIPAMPLFDSAFSAFARGTMLRAPSGPVAIEDLQPGDMLNTSSGEAAKVIWIGSTIFVPADTGERVPLVRIMADTLGPQRPSTFVTLGPAARLLCTPAHLRSEHEGVSLLTPAREFVDQVNVIEITPPTPVRLFHICLDRHAAIDAGGMEVETFHPGMSVLRQTTHKMRDMFLSLFPHISHYTDFGPLAHPRAPEDGDGRNAA